MRKIIPALIVLTLALGGVRAWAQLKQVRLSTTSVAVTEAQFRMAQLKGYYRDEGLDVEIVLIRGALGIQALLGGSVDYTSAAGSVIAAAARGLPVKLVLVVNSTPQFDLVGQPDIKSVSQLKGKVVGISSRGGAVDILTQTILSQHGVTANKDATLIVIGSPEELMAALKTGRIAACLLTSPRQLILYREGFSRLAYSGDYFSSYPTGGMGTTEDKIKNSPAEVLGMVRASIRGLQYFAQHRNESVDFISKYLGIKDRSLAAEVYDLQISRVLNRTYLEDAWMRGAIEFTRKSIGVSKEVSPHQVFDFTFAEKAFAGIKN